jgi:hypothetical protein
MRKHLCLLLACFGLPAEAVLVGRANENDCAYDRAPRYFSV